MNSLPRLSRLKDVASHYDALLCDAWGVIHNGVELFSGAAEALLEFRETRGPVIILTNAPRPSSVIPAQLDRLGLPREAYDAVVTSGDATKAEIAARLPAPVWQLGPVKDDALYEGLDIQFVPAEAAAFMICTGLVDDEREHPEDYRAVLSVAVERNLEMVCANPDIVVNRGGRMIWCAGALAQLYEELGGHVVYGGKPHAPIYRLAMSAVEAVKGAPVDASRTLAIGDGMNTDILGANQNDIDAVLVAGGGGIHVPDGEGPESAARPDMVMESLQW